MVKLTLEQAHQIIDAPRQLDEIDLVNNIYENLVIDIGKEAAEFFYNSPEIQFVKDANSIAQRHTINNYFSKLLLEYRGKGGNSIIGVIGYLSAEGETDHWIFIMVDIVIKYLKDNDVFGKVMS